jgi:hypothetical protein
MSARRNNPEKRHRHLSLSQQYFPTVWNQVTIVAVLKKDNTASVSNYRHISVLNNFSKLFEFVIHDHVSHYLKFKLNPSHRDFTKINPPIW